MKNIAFFFVGLSKKQIKQLPDKVYGIEKTLDVHELIELYSSAYVFLNLTYEDNYPTTNIIQLPILKLKRVEHRL